jgi:hypothetical protein
MDEQTKLYYATAMRLYIKDVVDYCVKHFVRDEFTELEVTNVAETISLSGDIRQDSIRVYNILCGEI